MGRPAKILIWLVAAIAAVFAVAAIALTFFFDPNDFREDIAAAVHESTGRELSIDGEISVQLFPWLAVEIGRTTLGNAEGFGDEPMVEVDQARLSVRVLPLLLRQEAEIGTAEIDGLRMRFEVDGNGRTNWDDLLDDSDRETSTDTGGDSGSLEVSGIQISNSSVSYVDNQSGSQYELKDVNIGVGRISEDAQSGALTVDGFSLQGLVDGLVDAPTRLSVETDGIEIRSAENMASIQPVAISVLDIDISAAVDPFSYADAIEPTAQIQVDAFSPRSLMHLFEVEAPETADPNALTSLKIDAKADVGANSISLTGVNIELDDTTFTGAMTVPTDGAGRFVVNLSADAIDLNPYMAPPSEDGDVPDGESAPTEIPADLIKPLNARGDLKIGTVTLGSLQLEQVVLSLNVSDGRLRLHPITAELYGGNYSGDVRIDASGSTPVLSMDEAVQDVDLAKLALAMFEQENITGSISGNFRLSGRGNDLAQVQRTLGGQMNFELKDGTYEGTDVWYELRRARAQLKQETPPEPVLPARTPFSSVRATGVVTDGVLRNDDFVADLPFMQLTGNGNVNLPDATVDYSLKARVLRKPEALEDATPEEIEDFTKTVIPLKITGPLASPKVTPDVEALLRERVEEELKDKLEDKLKDLFKR